MIYIYIYIYIYTARVKTNTTKKNKSGVRNALEHALLASDIAYQQLGEDSAPVLDSGAARSVGRRSSKRYLFIAKSVNT